MNEGNTKESYFSDSFTGIWLERSLVENKELSLSEKVIYSFISNIIKNGKRHKCWASHKCFSELTGLCDKTIRNLKERLKAKGYIDWKTIAIRQGDSYIKVCEYFDMKNKSDNFVAGKNTETAENTTLETANSAVNTNNNSNVLETNTKSYSNFYYDFIDAYPDEVSREYIDSKETLECIDASLDADDREESIHRYLPYELLELPNRKQGFVPMYMDDVYYVLKGGYSSAKQKEVGASILYNYFCYILSGKEVSVKLFNAYVRCLMYDLRIKNGKYIQWYKR